MSDQETDRLLQVMAKLRGAEGCPWDRAQSHRSLIPYLLEEAYELIEAIETGTDAELKEELGDVLLQVVFHARIAEERGAFSFADVAGDLAEKLISRHPHVFGGATAETPEEVSKIWHENKMRGRNSALEGVPSGLPALQWASQIGKRAARSGFEWNHEGEIIERMFEELTEFREAVEESTGDPPSEEMETELGDLFFAMVQLARWKGIEPESALRRSTRKFIKRFRAMETVLDEKGEKADQQTPEAWWALWNEAKSRTG